jgi:exosortase E/protease (VPEID-CTERM system)
VAWSARLAGVDGWRWFIPGAALFLAVLGSWFLALFPAESWLRWVRSSRGSVVGAIVTAALVQILRLQALDQWQPLTVGTLWCVEVLLRLLGQTTVFDPAITLVGTPRFSATVLSSCSGIEGIGIVTAFVGAYLWFCRRDFRFPAAFLLLPAAAISIWLLNVVRITALILIGGWSERIAVRGFHTVAGWLMCTVATCAMVVASRRMPAFSRAEVPSRAAAGPNPAAMYLLPLLAILLIAMLSSIAATSFDFAYPLRVVGVAAVLSFYRDKLMEFSRPISFSTSFSFSWFAVMLGAVVFVEWIVLQPGGSAVSENGAFAAGLAAMSPAVAALWLIFRIAGAIVTVPIAEELAFRGYLLRKLVSADFERVDFTRFTWLSFAVSSVLFGMMHREWLAGVIAGMLFAYAMYRRGALLDAVVAHSTANAMLAAYVLTTHRWSLWN